jgi:hypothetical protein
MRFMIMPLIIWAIGMVTKGLKNVEATPEKLSIPRFATQDNYTRNITHNTERLAV